MKFWIIGNILSTLGILIMLWNPIMFILKLGYYHFPLFVGVPLWALGMIFMFVLEKNIWSKK